MCDDIVPYTPTRAIGYQMKDEVVRNALDNCKYQIVREATIVEKCFQVSWGAHHVVSIQAPVPTIDSKQHRVLALMLIRRLILSDEQYRLPARRRLRRTVRPG
jgi:hypothetical protein